MPYEIDFLPVGDSNGDAICLRYGNYGSPATIHVVDGGYVDTGQMIVDHLNQYYDAPTFIDHVILSHADRDHAGGLATVLENFDIGCLWMNRPWLYANEIIDHFNSNFTVSGLQNRIRQNYELLVDLEQIALKRGIPIYEVFAGQKIGAFYVLAPCRATYVSLIADFDRTPVSKSVTAAGIFGSLKIVTDELRSWFETWSDEQLSDTPPATSASNESSVIQMGIIDGKRLLLTGDAGPNALEEAADVAQHLGILGKPDFFQIPHHGSRRNVTPSVLNRWIGSPVQEGSAPTGTAFCSVGANKPEYPRRRVQNAFLRRGFTVNSTRSRWICHFNGTINRQGAELLTSASFESYYEE